MSDEGEKTCPLCAEEMDLTDQQLKPCKCGYDICVWCWHQIMDMAEKDNTEGRCPACRTPYNKEKIVGTQSKCERLVTEMSAEKKQKLQKGKIKTSEGRKQLGSVRVIQRNLVYIVGLPLDLADEDLLQQKEYFGQYGKVLKVSISRTVSGAVQQFANSTCSVYITYSKEEEAIRSIQSAHGFVLEGRPLRACFGTTKYCHAWLRNMPCTNADCLYLHEFGPQEDSFTKDEIISAYTRIQQITGATIDMQRRSGNILPAPADEYSINNSTSSWPKPINKTTTNQSQENSMKVSPPNSSSGRSVALPAAASWGARASNSQAIVADVGSFKEPSKPQADSSFSSTPFSFSSAVASRDEVVKNHSEEKGKLGHPQSMKKVVDTDLSSSTSTSSSRPFSNSLKEDKITSDSMGPQFSNYSNSVLDNKDLNVSDEETIHKSLFVENQISQHCEAEQFAEPLASNEEEDIYVAKAQSDLVSDLQSKVSITDAEQDLVSFNDQRLRDTQLVTHTSYTQNLPHVSPCQNNSNSYSPQHSYLAANGSLDHHSVDLNLDKASQYAFNKPSTNGYSSTLDNNPSRGVSNGHSYFHDTEEDTSQFRMFEESKENHNNTALDIGESSIISNILSMDFDPWDESLTSPRNLAKFLGQTNKQQQTESHNVLSSRKLQNTNQSRFSFAREDEGSNYAQTLEYKNFNTPSFLNNNNNNSIYMDNKFSYGNGFSSFNYEEPATNCSPMSENKVSVSRAQVSAPPGFSGPSRAPPPGFTSHERMEQTFDNLSGNHMFDTYSSVRKSHQTPSPVYIGGVNDMEFMDPAILAVGGRLPNGSGLDIRSNYPAQPNSYENDARLQLLMQRSFSQQNLRFSEQPGDGGYMSRQTDSYGVPSSRMLEQSLVPNNFSSYQQTSYQQQPRSSSMLSNGSSHWNGWNESYQGGNDIAMAQLLRNERLGYNRFYSDDTKFQMPNSSDLYNRTFGI